MGGRAFAAVAVALATLGVARAEAGPKVPKALRGVELREGATRVEVDKRVRELGGRKVVAFRTHYRTELTAAELTFEDEGVELAIIDAQTKANLFRETIESTYTRYEYGYDAVTSSFEYRVSWKDHDGDDDDELVLALRDESGEGPPIAEPVRVWQVRYGALVEVSAEVAGCPRRVDDDGTFGGDEAVLVERKRAAIERFVELADQGARRSVLRCALGDALVASGLPVRDSEMPSGDITVVPYATDCPGADWAARNGVALSHKRQYVYAAPRGMVITAVQNGAVTYAQLIDFVEPLFIQNEVTTTLLWSETWILDARVWFIGELSFAAADGSPPERYVVVYDPVSALLVTHLGLAEYQTARLEHRTRQQGHFELVVESRGKDQKKIFTKEAASWRQ